MVMLGVVQRIHADVFRALPKAALLKSAQLHVPIAGWADWDVRAALQRRRQQVPCQAQRAMLLLLCGTGSHAYHNVLLRRLRT